MYKSCVVTYGDGHKCFTKLTKVEIERGVLHVTGENMATGKRESLIVPISELKSLVGTYDSDCGSREGLCVSCRRNHIEIDRYCRSCYDHLQSFDREG